MLRQHDHTPLDSIAIHFAGQPVPLGFVTQLKSIVHSRELHHTCTCTLTFFLYMYMYFKMIIFS